MKYRKTNKKRRVHTLRVISNIAFLILFIVIMISGKVQLWFGLFLLGVLISFFMGRFYCGWVCPMYSLSRPVAWLYKKLKIRRRPVPGLLQASWIRYVFLVFFLGLMVFQQVKGLRLPILPALTALSVLFVLIFEEKWWHSRVCPFGTVLDLTTRPAAKGLKIDPDSCIARGICELHCPTDAIVRTPLNGPKDSKRRIIPWRCLQCMECVDPCPTRSIKYRRLI